MAKSSGVRIQPNWIIQFGTLIDSMGSVVFTCGSYEVELAARPIPILSPCFALDKKKKKNLDDKIINTKIFHSDLRKYIL